MPKVPRAILKEYFQTGDKPTQPQFSTMLDSMVNFVDDREYIGLREYNPALEYIPGDCAVFGNQVVECNTATTGVFNPAHWTVLSAFGSVTYVSAWDTQNNIPPLQSSVGTKGFYYVVTNASPDPNLNTELNGIDDWAIGDWAIFNGSVWQKVDNSESPVAAENVSYVPSGNLSATNVQDALDELETEKQPRINVKVPALPYSIGAFQFSDSWLKRQDNGIAIDLRRVFRSERLGEGQLDFGNGGDEVKLSTSGFDAKESRLLLNPKEARLLGDVVIVQHNDGKSQLYLVDSGQALLSNDGGTDTDAKVQLKQGYVEVSQADYGKMTIGAGLDSNGQTVLNGAGNSVDITKDNVTISNVFGTGATIDLDSAGTITSTAASIVLDGNVELPQLTADTVPVLDGTQNLVSSSVTATELNNLSGVAGPIQTQLNAKLNLSGGSMTGALTLAADPVTPLEAATKQYVDNGDTTLQTNIDSKVSKAGDTMTGLLVLSGDPVSAFGAATRQYVDTADSNLQTQVNDKVSKAGSTMTGLLTLSGDPVSALEAVTKQYADAIQSALSAGKVNKSGDTMTGPLILSGNPTNALGAATKQYVDDATKKILLPLTFDSDFSTNSGSFTSIARQVVIPAADTVFPGATTITAKLTIDYMCENGSTPAQGEAGITEWTAATSGSPSLVAGSSIAMAATAGAWTKATSSSSFVISGNRSYRIIFRKTLGSANANVRIEAAMLTLYYS